MQRERSIYILLSIFLGMIGVHNFYAGRKTQGIVQAIITILIGWMVLPLLAVVIWIIFEICTVTTDGDGVPFK